MQLALKEKKRAFREWKALHTEELLGKYIGAKSAAKPAVAMAKGKKYDDVYEKLGMRQGEMEV